jgi:hypothetical protein
MNSLAIYRALLCLYPRDYRDAFADEMLDVFAAAAQSRNDTRFVTTELAALLTGAAREWVAKLTTDRAVRGRVLPDLRMMRPAGVSKEAWFSEAAMSAYRRP